MVTKMYRVYSIIERPKQEDYWLNIGMAYPHEKGDGFNVILQALPLHGKLVLRAYDSAAVGAGHLRKEKEPGWYRFIAPA